MTLRLLIAACLCVHAQTTSVVRLFPIDDSARDPAFRSYVERLRSVVETRDTNGLRKLVADDVLVGPDDADKGWDKFVATWRPDDRRESALWGTLADFLSLGFIREHPSLFLSPYLVWRFPPEFNMATHLVVVRDKAPLRESPAPRAPVIGSLSFEIVRRLGETERGEELVRWVHVRTLDGQTGYLNANDAMSPLMPRAQFGLRGRRWLLVALEGHEIKPG